MLRISESAQTEGSQPHYLSIDKKKRQITLTDPTTSAPSSQASQERGPKVAAPKIFAFDNLFTDDDAQTDVTSSALSEVIPAVLEGTDGCLLTLGYAESGMWKINILPPSLINACNETSTLDEHKIILASGVLILLLSKASPVGCAVLSLSNDC